MMVFLCGFIMEYTRKSDITSKRRSNDEEGTDG